MALTEEDVLASRVLLAPPLCRYLWNNHLLEHIPGSNSCKEEVENHGIQYT